MWVHSRGQNELIELTRKNKKSDFDFQTLVCNFLERVSV